MAIYMWREGPSYVIDYATDIAGEYSSFIDTYFWVAFTPKKNCTLDKIYFIWNTNWTLKIAQWPYASSYTLAETYTISSAVTEYELWTPYQLTAGTTYTISLHQWGGYFGTQQFPVDWENVTFNYGTYSSTNTPQTTSVYIVKWIQTAAI